MTFALSDVMLSLLQDDRKFVEGGEDEGMGKGDVRYGDTTVFVQHMKVCAGDVKRLRAQCISCKLMIRAPQCVIGDWLTAITVSPHFQHVIHRYVRAVAERLLAVVPDV